MTRGKTEQGRIGFRFLCFLVEPVLPGVTTKTQVRTHSYVVLQIDNKNPDGTLQWPKGQAKIDELVQERGKDPTLNAVIRRARSLYLPTPPWLLQSPDFYRRQDALEARRAHEDEIARLHSVAASLRARGTEHGLHEASIIEGVIAGLRGG